MVCINTLLGLATVGASNPWQQQLRPAICHDVLCRVLCIDGLSCCCDTSAHWEEAWWMGVGMLFVLASGACTGTGVPSWLRPL